MEASLKNQDLPNLSNDVIGLLKGILTEMQKNSSAAQLNVFIEVLTVGTTSTALYSSQKKVRGGNLMNLSTTDPITIAAVGASQAGKPIAAVAGQGFIMNPASTAGQGGGTYNFANIDLSTLTAITPTNNTQLMAVVYYV